MGGVLTLPEPVFRASTIRLVLPRKLTEMPLLNEYKKKPDRRVGLWRVCESRAGRAIKPGEVWGGIDRLNQGI
jgi:hypothetical protein